MKIFVRFILIPLYLIAFGAYIILVLLISPIMSLYFIGYLLLLNDGDKDYKLLLLAGNIFCYPIDIVNKLENYILKTKKT